MARKRVDGRFARAEDAAQGEGKDAVAGVPVGAPRPRYCRAFARKRIAEEMPELVAMLLKEAKGGSLGHLKMLVQLGGLDKGEVTPKVQRREKSLEALLTEQWERRIQQSMRLNMRRRQLCRRSRFDGREREARWHSRRNCISRA